MMRAAFTVLLLLLATPAQATSVACEANGAVKSASEHPRIVDFCKRVELGCDFKAQHPVTDEYNPDRTWVVTASQIHSRDEQGQPRFMPEGALFADVSQECKVTKVFGHGIDNPAAE